MAFTKIQPQQLQLPTFLSPSGDLNFADNSTGFNIDLSRSLEGDFDIIGSLTVSSSEVVVSNSSNSSDSLGKAIGGQNNTATGLNVVLNGNDINANSGSFNTALNGSNSRFGRSGEFNTIIGGRNVVFSDKITGSMIIADQKSSAQSITKNHSLLVSFDSGIEFKSASSGIVFSDDVVFDDLVYINNSVTFEDQADFNSNITVDGTSTFGDSVTINSSLDTTGNSTFGVVDITGNLSVTGNLDVTGTTQFAGSVDIDNTLTLQDNSEAASEYWVNRIGSRFKIDNSYPSDLSSYLDTAYGNSFGTNSTDEVLNTGQPVTGLLLVDTVANPDEAKLVFVTEYFTGVIDFTKFQYVT